jgi:hypothetical protein
MIKNSSILWHIMARSPLKINRRFWGKWSNFCFILVSSLDYSPTLKMEAICFSEKSVDSQRTTWHCIPEDRTLHSRWHVSGYITISEKVFRTKIENLSVYCLWVSSLVSVSIFTYLFANICCHQISKNRSPLSVWKKEPRFLFAVL